MDLEKIKEYFYSNIIKTAMAFFLTFGGIIALIYMLSSGVSPTLSFDSVIYALWLFSFAGISFLILFSSIFIVPGLFWNYTIIDDTKFDFLWSFSDEIKSRRYKNLIFIGVISSIYLAIVLAAYQQYIISFLISAILLLISYLFGTKKFRLSPKETLKRMGSLLFSGIISSAVSILPITFIVLQAAKKEPNSLISQLSLIGILAVITIVANMLVFYRPQKLHPLTRNTAIALATFITISVILGDVTIIPKAVAKVYKFGSYEVSSIYINSKSCNFLASENIAKKSSLENTCTVKDATVVNSLGERYVFKVNDNKYRIKTSEVLSESWPDKVMKDK